MADERLWAVTSTSLAPDPQFCYTTWQTQFTIWRLNVHSTQCFWPHLCLCAFVCVCVHTRMSVHLCMQVQALSQGLSNNSEAQPHGVWQWCSLTARTENGTANTTWPSDGPVHKMKGGGRWGDGASHICIWLFTMRATSAKSLGKHAREEGIRQDRRTW